MNKKSLSIEFQEYASIEDLPQEDRQVMNAAIQATDNAYAPYSDFHVGAALLLGNGLIVTGSNQENVAYPSGLCAERTAMFSASHNHPGVAFKALAIVARNPEGTLVGASPCGACRQVMAEYEQRQGEAMRFLLYQNNGSVRVMEGVACLLPFAFEM